MYDQTEAKERGIVKPKLSTTHPYAAIEHRVIDSAAYADLSHSACRLLTLIVRQLTKDNNGQLHATFSWCQPRGIGSEHTLRDAIADLIAHGMIYRTRSHGANRAWARYAVTWLPVKNRKGLFLDSFKSCAWRDWEPPKEKSSPQKVQDQSGRKCSFTTENPAESAGNLPAKSAGYELMPCRGVDSALQSTARVYRLVPRRPYIYAPSQSVLVTRRQRLNSADSQCPIILNSGACSITRC